MWSSRFGHNIWVESRGLQRYSRICWIIFVSTLVIESMLERLISFFSKWVEDSTTDMISNLFGFQIVQNLGNYLGVPLFHQRVTKTTMYFVVEKVRMKLQSWDAKQFSVVGRVTLAESVLLSIHSYFMQSMLLPRKFVMRSKAWWNTLLGDPQTIRRRCLL